MYSTNAHAAEAAEVLAVARNAGVKDASAREVLAR
jgi:hypothetical protein